MDILYHDDHYIAVNKPPNLLVHRSRLSEDRVFLLQQLRDHIGQRLYPVHRLDRATSGVIVFGTTPEAAAALVDLFTRHQVQKSYLAIVRGYLSEQGVIDSPLQDLETNTGLQTAVTAYRNLGQTDFPHPIGKRYPSARYSLLDVTPQTGRRQQIRKHLSHIRHPILGDKQHGDVKHNSYFRDHFGLERLFLHARHLHFNHPFSGVPVHIGAALDEHFVKCLSILNFNNTHI
jgi:tRNA pseudouridine65 synthase